MNIEYIVSVIRNLEMQINEVCKDIETASSKEIEDALIKQLLNLRSECAGLKIDLRVAQQD